MAALNNVELSTKLKEYQKLRRTVLTLGDQVTHEEYVLTIPEGKEKIFPPDFQMSKQR